MVVVNFEAGQLFHWGFLYSAGPSVIAGSQAPPMSAASSRKALAEQHRSTDKLRATISHLEAMAQRQAKDAVLAPQVRP